MTVINACFRLSNSQMRVGHRKEVATLMAKMSDKQADFTAALTDRQLT